MRPHFDHAAGSTVYSFGCRAFAVLGLTTALLVAGHAQAETYPHRPITLIAPYAVGGDSDMAARNFAAAATRALGQAVVVVNKTGASGIIGSAQAVAAPADGYTLLLARPGSQAILPAIMPTMTKYKWDDYSFVGTLELNPYGCVVNSKSPYRTFGDLVDALRSKGKTLNFGTAGVLTTNDMGPRQLFKMLKLTEQQTPTQIPYKATSETATSLLGGQTDFACGSMGSFIGLIKGGQLRPLLVTTAERMSIFPDVPTARELGYADMEGIVGWSGIYAPANLPADVREKLAAAMKTVAADPAWLAGTAATGSLPYVLSPEETKEFARKQYDLYRSLGEMLDLIDKAKM